MPSNKPETPCKSTIPSVTKKPHSDFYYKYHFYKKLAFGLSGLRSFGTIYDTAKAIRVIGCAAEPELVYLDTRAVTGGCFSSLIPLPA